MASRRFSDRETAEILRRAAEIQHRGSDSGPGYTEAELRSAAQEIGIEPAALQAAIREAGTGQGQAKPGLWGGPFESKEEWFTDRPISSEEWEDLVAAVRDATGEDGQTTERGLASEWRGTGGGLISTTVTARTASERPMISATIRFEGLAVLAYMLSGLSALVALPFLAMLFASNVAFSLWATLTVGQFLVVRTLLPMACKRRTRRVIDSINAVTSALLPSIDARVNLADEGPQLDSDSVYSSS